MASSLEPEADGTSQESLGGSQYDLFSNIYYFKQSPEIYQEFNNTEEDVIIIEDFGQLEQEPPPSAGDKEIP